MWGLVADVLRGQLVLGFSGRWRHHANHWSHFIEDSFLDIVNLVEHLVIKFDDRELSHVNLDPALLLLFGARCEHRKYPQDQDVHQK